MRLPQPQKERSAADVNDATIAVMVILITRTLISRIPSCPSQRVRSAYSPLTNEGGHVVVPEAGTDVQGHWTLYYLRDVASRAEEAYRQPLSQQLGK